MTTRPPAQPALPAVDPGAAAREELFRCVLRGDPLPALVRAAERALGRAVRVELVNGPAVSPAAGPGSAPDAPVVPGRRFPIAASRRRLGTLFVSEAEGPTSPAERARAREIAVAFALFALLRAAAAPQAATASAAEKRDPWLERRFEAWWRERQHRAEERLAVLSVMLPEPSPRAEAIAAVARGLESLLAARRIDAFVAWRGHEASVAFVASDQRADRLAASIATNLAAQLRVTSPTVRFYVGIAQTGPASRFALRAEQARLAAEIGVRNQTTLTTSMTELRAFGAIRAAMSGSDSPTAFKELHARYLGALLAHEDRTKLPLLRTLMAYFDDNCNISAAARRLGMRRQSLYYRLRRVEELCDLDLEDPFDRFALELAFRSWAGSSPEEPAWQAALGDEVR